MCKSCSACGLKEKKSHVLLQRSTVSMLPDQLHREKERKRGGTGRAAKDVGSAVIETGGVFHRLD